MKIKHLLLLCLLFCSMLPTSGQNTYPNLTIQPAQPQPAKTIRFTYDPKGTALAGKTVEAIAYVYDHQQLEAHDVTLTKSKGIWTGSVPTKASSAGFYLHFLSGEEHDNNNQQGYAFLLYDSKKKPVKGAHGGLANTQSIWAGMMNITRNTEQAALNLEKEFRIYPENKRNYLYAYAMAVGAEKPEQAEALILKELDALYSAQDLTVQQLEAISNLYLQYNQQEKAGMLVEKAKQIEPKGSVAQQAKMKLFFDEADLNEKQALAEELAREFPESEQTTWALGMVAMEMAKQKQYQEFKEFLSKYPKVASWSVYNEAAWQMALAEEQLDLALDFAVKGYALAKQNVDSPKEEKPFWLSQKQWQEQRRMSLGMVGDTYGYILMKQKRFAEAMPLMEEAVKMQKEQSIEINQRYVEALLGNNKPELAKERLEHYIRNGNTNASMKQQLQELYAKEKGSEAGFDAYLSQLEAPALEKLRSSIQKKLISVPAPSFMLQDLEGNKVALSELKGKTVIVDFWATWCGPCINSFPAMQQAVNKFKHDDQVAFLFINSWERAENPKQHVSDFIAKRNLNFLVLLDSENKTIGDFKVDGIPTKFIIDKEGNIRYKSIGFGGNDEAAVAELSMLIEILR